MATAATMISQCALLLFLLIGCLAPGLQARNKTPLIDEDSTRARNKAAECVFGKQVRELGSQWIPDLGEPIGVLYCMKCECIPLQKKRRIVGKVQCRSIKNECPEPSCDHPVQLAGRCCKTCPGDQFNSDLVQDSLMPNLNEDDEKATKHYIALLSGRSSLTLKDNSTKTNNVNKNNVVATGRFFFHKKNLHYSFYISDKAARPRSLQFVDSDGNILEEFLLSRAGGLVNSLYQNATRKVCGIWRRIPRDYRKLLKHEKLYAVLVWGVKDQAEFTLSGQLTRNAALPTELFSSLLEPMPGTSSEVMASAGGTAIVYINTPMPTSLHLAIIFNGVFTKDETADVPISVTLTAIDDRKAITKDKQVILDEVQIIKKPLHELNQIEISSQISSANLRLLTRGRLLLTVASLSHPEILRLSGLVMTKASCELFQTTLAGDFPNPYGTSGLAWMFLNNEGSLVYNIQVENLDPKLQNSSIITLMDVSSKRKTELEDLTPYYANGWANGTIDKLSPKVLEPLYSGNLAVNVATPNGSLVKGRLVPKLVSEARDASAPYLLLRETYTLPPSVVGLAWLLVDNECHLHYDVTVSGLGQDRRLELHLDLVPIVAPGAPVTTRLLEDFQGSQVEGGTLYSVEREELNLLNSGVGFLKVKDKDTRTTLLAATVRHLAIPASCRPSFTDNNVPGLPLDGEEVRISTSKDCFYEGKFYEEETQWTSAKDSCTMCYCQSRDPNCFTMKCPHVACPNPVFVAGECCPVCNFTSNLDSNKNTLQKCSFNGKSYSPGSRFHPFLVPTGFEQCTICTCDPMLMEVKCSRITNSKECNANYEQKIALNAEQNEDDLDAPRVLRRKENKAEAAEEIFKKGGCRNAFSPWEPYRNGTEYHPKINSLGEFKCAICKCENGESKCKRVHCSKDNCKQMVELRRLGKKAESMDTCCRPRDCRKYKHRKHRQTT